MHVNRWVYLYDYHILFHIYYCEVQFMISLIYENQAWFYHCAY